MFSEAPIKQNSFKTAFEICCRRLVEFDVSGETIPDAWGRDGKRSVSELSIMSKLYG